jgi:hypothetical protein
MRFDLMREIFQRRANETLICAVVTVCIVCVIVLGVIGLALGICPKLGTSLACGFWPEDLSIQTLEGQVSYIHCQSPGCHQPVCIGRHKLRAYRAEAQTRLWRGAPCMNLYGGGE